MTRVLAALFVAVSLVFGVQAAVPAEATPASVGCENTWGGGCINVDRGGGGPLFVHSAQPGVWGDVNTGDKYGRYRVRLTRKSNGIPTIIRVSTPRWVHITNLTSWGPVYVLDKGYADGDVLCGDFTGYKPDNWGCIEVHS